MTDSSINIDLNDPRAGKIADAISNKTAKKILHALSMDDEISGSEIADKLGLPLNTVSYNLKKLHGAGLVDKSKRFFWSSKGKKMDLYKLSNKKIVISPRIMSRNILASMAGVLGIVVIAILLFSLNNADIPVVIDNNPIVIGGIEIGNDVVKKFNSIDEMKEFLEENVGSRDYGYGYYGDVVAEASVSAVQSGKAADSAGAVAPRASDYSETNVQIQGVDEPDFVKNDGKYIYVATGNKVMILNAFPAEDMETLSEIEFDERVSNIFVNGDKMVIFSERHDYVNSQIPCLDNYYEVGYKCGGYSVQETVVHIYDISDRENAKLDETVKADGRLVDARMIDEYVYVISSKYINLNWFDLPRYEVSGVTIEIDARDVSYIDSSDENYVYNSITAINLEDNEVNSEVFLMGSASTIFVSEDNIYLTYMKQINPNFRLKKYVNEVLIEVLPAIERGEVRKIMDGDDRYYEKQRDVNEVVRDYFNDLDPVEGVTVLKEYEERNNEFNKQIAKETEKTIVHKIEIDEEDIEYEGKGEVPGRVLNQFSMDEHKGNLRIATTSGNLWGGTSENHLYILDDDLELIGSVEGLAEGERIYSVRFLGDRAYIVTFKKVDPLFVIDVSNPRAPEVLGYLKITGYSDYLHIYDENHVIGIGKETVAPTEDEARGRDLDFAWYQGVKISLFDVSDVHNPTEKAKIIIGDRGTDSYALQDHKAFLFDKERELLVIPIGLSKIDESRYPDGEIPGNAFGERIWQGAYVLNINTEDISVRGKITHYDEGDTLNRWYYGGQKAIQRSLYMDDVLYTISQSKVKANWLDSVEEISEVKIGEEKEVEPYVVY